MSIRMTRRRAAVVAVGAVVVGTVAVLPALPASAATACSVTYKIVNQWSNGFQGGVTLKNTGDAWTSWTLTFSFANGQTVSQGWSGKWAQSSANVTVTNETWNGSVANGGVVDMGFTANLPSATNAAPTSFSVNGVVCGGTSTPTSAPVTSRAVTSAPVTSRAVTSAPVTSRAVTSAPVTSRAVTSAPVTSAPVTSGPVVTSAAPSTPSTARVDNPYAGANGYINPDYAAQVNAAAAAKGGTLGAAMAKVAQQPTAVWLDRIAAINGANGAKGLAAHLDAALAQQTSSGKQVVATIVIYDLPNRDCSALASNGELLIANNGLARYKTEYIDPIVAIMSQSKYASLRISTILEPDSLPNLITNLSFAKCAEANSTGAYVDGVAYAAGKLHAIPNVYTYVDVAHSGWLGWDSNLTPFVNLMATLASRTTGGYSAYDGFVSNTANTTPTIEPYMTATQSIGGNPVRSANFYQWNQYIDEQSFVQALRTALIAKGFPSTIGMMIDTSRNGWGGSARPAGASTSTDLNTFVNATKIDRRIHRGNWCNQNGAGIGFRPQANPAAGLDAYVWIKPPGESDGASAFIPNDEGKGADPMCDPTYTGNSLNGNNLTNALPNAPLAGKWFPAQFEQLVTNAYPAL
ncbi:glycoside hydrolase family 6 protein [Luedemannella flava]|uniref:Glucanase n=1 Tax=Luedemannella flava TaxID=349316 RepID=A0ABN2LFE6_9ACTN